MRDAVPPIEPGTMVKGGWNRDLPPGPRPRIVPKPYGVPFDPRRAENVQRDALAAEAEPDRGEVREPIPPLEPGKMVKGGWNRDLPPGPRRNMVPGAMGVPFDREMAEQIRRNRLARLAQRSCGNDARAPGKPVQSGRMGKDDQNRSSLGGRAKSKPRRFFGRFVPANLRHD